MATAQEYADFRKQVTDFFGGGSTSARAANNPFLRTFGSALQPKDRPQWYSDILAALRPSSSVATDEARDRIMSQVRGSLAQNSNQIRSIFEGSRQVRNDPGWMEELNTTFGNLSGTAPNQYVNPNTGQPGSPYTPPTPTTPPPPPGPYVPPAELSTPEAPVNSPTAPSDIGQFIGPTSEQQQNIINQAIAQSQGVADTNLEALNDLFRNNIISQVNSWTDPNGPDFQLAMGQLNNMGRADPGTFGQSLSSRLAPLISQSLTEASARALQPSFDTQQGLVQGGAGVQSGLGMASLQRFMQQADFQKQAQLAKELGAMGVPSNFQQGVGGASSILSGLGSFFQGIPGIKEVTKGCFLSTACVSVMGMPDDCRDLTILRYFRDNFVDPKEVEAYYAIAPKILATPKGREMVYRSVYERMIKPCVRLITAGRYNEAFRLYKSETLRILHGII